MEDGFKRHDIAFHAAGNGDNLTDSPASVCVGQRMKDEIHRRRHRGHHESVSNILAGEERERAQFGDRFTGGVRMDRAHAWKSTVQGDEEIQALLLSDLADNDPRRTHPECFLDQPA
jgi:hypothetical protein